MADLSSKEIAALKRSAHDLPVAVQVGKAGLSEGAVAEVREQLEREPLVKVRLLKSALEGADKRALAAALAEATGAVLVELKGFTVVLYRPPRRKRAP